MDCPRTESRLPRCEFCNCTTGENRIYCVSCSVAYLWASEYLLEPAKFMLCFHGWEKVTAGAHKREPVLLALWKPCLASHPSDWRRTGRLVLRPERPKSGCWPFKCFFFNLTLRTKTSWLGAHNNKNICDENDLSDFDFALHI